MRALAVHGGRLYYSVDEGPEIWSVGLNQDGSFGTDPRSELLAKGDSASPVTNIAFDAQGRMLLAQRGAQKGAYDYGAFVDAAPTQVLRYALETPDNPATPGIWSPTPDSYAAGFAAGGKSASGGLSLQYGYRPDGTLDANACQGTVALTADGIAEDGKGHGAQLNAVDLVLPANLPPKQSAFIDFDSKQDAADLKGHAGDVKSYQPCGGPGFPPVAGGGGGGAGGGGGFPPVAGAGGGGFPPVAGGGGAQIFPPVAGGGGTTTNPPVEGGGGTTTNPPVEGGGGNTVQQGPLKITKTGVSQSCNETDPCTFIINVENTTDTAVPGPTTITDTLSAGGASLAGAKITGTPTAPWTCTGAGPSFTCTDPNPIPPHTSVPLTISFVPGTLATATEIKNCATSTPASGTQAQTAPAVPPPVAGEANGIKVELKLAVTPAPPVCQADGCPFLWTVTNEFGRHDRRSRSHRISWQRRFIRRCASSRHHSPRWWQYRRRHLSGLRYL